MRLYKYDPFSVLGKENCTVGALRAQAEGWDVSIVARGIKATGTGAIDLAQLRQSRPVARPLIHAAATVGPPSPVRTKHHDPGLRICA